MQNLDLRVLPVLAALTAFVGCQSLEAQQPDDAPVDPVTAQDLEAAVDQEQSAAATEALNEALDDAQKSLDEAQDRVEDEALVIEVDDPEVEEVVVEDVEEPEAEAQTFDYIDDRNVEVVEVAEVQEDVDHQQISLLVGYREYTDDGIFGDDDGEFAAGIEYAHEIDHDLGFEIGVMGSLGTDGGVTGDADVTAAALELYGGARYWYDHGDWHPYAGLGVAAIYAGVDNDTGGQVADDQDLTFGVYLHGGVQYDVSETVYFAVDARTLFGTDLELQTVTGDADYWQLGLILGFNL